MTQHRAIVLATLEQSSARSRADMFRLKSIVRLPSRIGSERSHLSFGCYPFLCLHLPRTALVSAFMSSAIQRRPAITHALGGLVFCSLMAEAGRMGFSTTTRYLDPN